MEAWITHDYWFVAALGACAQHSTETLEARVSLKIAKKVQFAAVILQINVISHLWLAEVSPMATYYDR